NQTVHPGWAQFQKSLQGDLAGLWERGGAGLVVLTEKSSSPSLQDLRTRLLASYPNAKWTEYEPVSWDAMREGANIAFGAPYRVHADFKRASVVVALDDDLFGYHPTSLKNARDFMEGRGGSGENMNRMYAIEPVHSITGSMADHRLPLRASEIEAFTHALASELAKKGVPIAGAIQGKLKTGAHVPAEFVATMAEDLANHRGRSIVTAGYRQPASVHALVNAINTALGNIDKTVLLTRDPEGERPSHEQAIADVAADMNAGRVKVLAMLGGNPVYDAPADLDFGAALAKVPTSIHLSLYEDETSRKCTWHLPQAHYLEAWNDARAWDGTVSTVQPLIDTLYDGKTNLEVVAMMLGEQPFSGFEIVRRTFRSMAGPVADFEKSWRRALHEGIVENTALPTDRAALNAAAVAGALHGGSHDEGFEVLFTHDARVFDGRFANSSWLQEMPDPMTKVTWDNTANMSPASAEELGVKTGDIVNVTVEGKSLSIPVYVMPGHAPRSVSIALGYGRTAAGHVGDGVGANAYALRTTKTGYIAHGGQIKGTGARAKLATTQDHYLIDDIGMSGYDKRYSAIVREAQFVDYKKKGKDAFHHDHHPPLVSLWKEPEFEGAAWGMSVDLSKCTGCGTCVIACVAENNIPVVGKDEVRRGREMQWLRIDRYFHGDKENPTAIHQPLHCQQCENAPCEQVCPVGATQHNEEGLNDMAYNRCIGTRYCANNCPYKVRRFNYFNNQDPVSPIEKMVYNPNVTVRSRGVMEKCTWCVQRINRVKIDA
ncbi:MAG: 4Fe-4S dicluster domain-containing protein, partial [Gemmatimonadetes bacterium]|nr:4Fe-4S dicluster domain-containing protein [Gemmatimonadota bacterium]